jgi:hypothetical protein
MVVLFCRLDEDPSDDRHGSTVLTGPVTERREDVAPRRAGCCAAPGDRTDTIALANNDRGEILIPADGTYYRLPEVACGRPTLPAGAAPAPRRRHDGQGTANSALTRTGRRLPARSHAPARITHPALAHAPDFFVRAVDGAGVVVDCRPADRVGPRDDAAFKATAGACELIGWGYQLVGAADPVVVGNVRWLAGYRHPRYRGLAVATRLVKAFVARRLELPAGCPRPRPRVGVDDLPPRARASNRRAPRDPRHGDADRAAPRRRLRRRHVPPRGRAALPRRSPTPTGGSRRSPDLTPPLRPHPR